jgi:hypothetical protein
VPRDNSQFDPLFYAAGEQHGIDPVLIKALGYVESRLNPNARSGAGAQGIMQILPSTAAGLGINNAYDPSQAIPAAAAYIAEGYDKHGNVADAIRYYHGGPNTRGWGPKTQDYLAKVSNAYQGLKGTVTKKKEDDPYADLIKEFSGSPAAAPTTAPATSPAAPAAAATTAPEVDPYGGLIKEFTAQPVTAPAAVAAPAPVATSAAPSKAYRGSVLPFSIDDEGKPHLDFSAGITGSLASSLANALTLPGDVATGKVNPLTDEGIVRSMALATIGSPLNAKATARAAVRPAAPSADALREAATAGYDAMRSSGATYSADAVAALAQGLKQQAENKGILNELAPKSFSVINKLTEPPAGSIAPITGLEAARRAFGNAGKDFANPTEQLAAQHFKQGLDDFVRAADPATVVSGDAAAAGNALTQARGNYAAAKRSERLTTTEENASRRAEATHSGLNSDNAIRGRVASLLQNPKAIAGFSEAERAALEEVARGTASRNTIRWVGNYLGGGGGLGGLAATTAGGTLGALTGGGYAGAGVGAGIGAAIPPAIGASARSLANYLTARSLGRADELVRTNSPLYNQLTQGMMERNLLLMPQLMGRGLGAYYFDRERQ